MVGRQKEFRKILYISIFVSCIFFSNIIRINNLNPPLSEKKNNDSLILDKLDNPIISNSNLNLTSYISGEGVNQTVRIFVENSSFSNDNRYNFNITSPMENMNLTYGEFNFTFDNNYTTLHSLENTNALSSDIQSYLEAAFNSDNSYSQFFYENGMNITQVDLNNLIDNDLGTNITINSTTAGLLNFTIRVNFTGTDFESAYHKAHNTPFNWINVLGLRLTLTYNLSMDANFTILMKDFNDSGAPFWRNISSTVFINSSIDKNKYINDMITNENLNLIRNPYYNLSLWSNFTGTFSFDNELGHSGTAIEFIDEHNGTQTATVIKEEDTHEYVLKIEDTSDSDYVGVYNNLSVYQPNGTIEFWYKTNNVTKPNYIDLFGNNGSIQTIFINNSQWYYIDKDNLTALIPNVNDPISNEWMHIRIDFECTDGDYSTLGEQEFKIYVDGINSGILDFRGINNNNTKFGKLGFRTNISNDGINIIQYIDAIGYSWNESYSIGDNFKRVGFINEANCSVIQFVFNRSDAQEFNVTIYEFDFNATYGFEVPITNNSQVALEFDLRGESTKVNGFYAWIRTLNRTRAEEMNTHLNITLYRANGTITRDQVDNLNIIPDKDELIDNIVLNYTLYNADEITYFEFDNITAISNLGLYNYFIVIKSNCSENIYSLVTIPEENYGDKVTDHQLRRSIDGGYNWIIVRSDEKGNTILDASSFKINVTRGYKPEDFVNGLKIDGMNIIGVSNDWKYPNSSPLQWGLGRWENYFTNPVKSNLNNLFQINLTWDTNLTYSFLFNVSYYNVKAFIEENATSSYNVTYDDIPIWTLNYTLNFNSTLFDNWNLTEFWYIYPDYYTPTNLTTPAPYKYQVLSNTTGSSIFIDNSNYRKIIVSTNIINISDYEKYNGTFQLYLTSENYITDDDMHSYINYKGDLWETNGFMFGDNISISLDLQDHDGKAPINGNATIILFYENGTKYYGHELFEENGKFSNDLSYLVYDFGNKSIFMVNNSIPRLGSYYLGYFWTNGSSIGCRKKEILITTYNISIDDFEYDPNLEDGINILSGRVDNVLSNYTLLIASVNDTTGIPLEDFYPINNSISQSEGKFSINYKGEPLEVHMQTFLQNETILNPNETINIKSLIQNLNPAYDINVRLHVKLVSLANEEWIITEAYTPTVLLDKKGAFNPSHEFSVNLTMPELQPDDIWYGVNSPVRKAGAKVNISIYIEDEFAGMYTTNSQDDYCVIINKTEEEFEGYIIKLKIPQNEEGPSFLRDFNREDCIYLPNKTTFIINVFDENYVSSYNHYIKKFGLLTDSEFSDIVIDPVTPLYGKSFNISSILATEFGDPLSYKNVTLQYNNSGAWMNLTHQLTDINGTNTFEINTLDLNILDDTIEIKLIWAGDTDVLNNLKNITITIEMQTNSLSISVDEQDQYAFRETNSTLKINIRNTGNSNLKILEIDFDINENLNYQIVSMNNLIYNYFAPGGLLELIIEVEIPNVEYDLLNITITVKAQNILSKENITIEEFISITIRDKELWDSVSNYFMLIVIGLIALIWIAGYIYVKRVNKRIETISRPQAERRPRKGRYVKVSELEPSKKEPKTKPVKDLEKVEKPLDKTLKKKGIQKGVSEEKIEKKKGTDLDSLLKEKGLDKKEKK